MQNPKLFNKTPVVNNIIMSAMVLILATIIAGPAATAGETPATLAVTGHGEVAATPDQATVRLGAIGQAKEAAEAQNQVNQIMHNALREIKALGVADHGIQTAGLTLSPVYTRVDRSRDPNAEKPHIAGYRASNTITVQVENIALIGKVIDAGVRSGANQLQGVTFDVREDDEYRLQALKLAAQKAREKAEAIAAALHLRLGEIQEIREEGVHFIRPAAGRSYAMAAESTPVQPGRIQIKADIMIQYRIEGQGK